MNISFFEIPTSFFILFFVTPVKYLKEKKNKKTKDRQKSINCFIVQCPWAQDLTFHITDFFTTKSHISIKFLIINSHSNEHL
jgi:hypothetical protein